MNSKIVNIYEFSLISLLGAPHNFAQKYFQPTEILSLAYCRALISNHADNDYVTAEAFELLRFIITKRLSAGKLTVIDVQSDALLALAHKYQATSIALIFNEELPLQGFEQVTILKNIETPVIKRVPLRNNLKQKQGPFDIIGDIHGCFDELRQLLEILGYTLTHPQGRQVIFLGDLVDRGPKTPEVLRLVMDMVSAGSALCVLGNHDVKLKRKLQGKNVKLTHGLSASIQQLEHYPPEFHQEIIDFLDNLVSHYVLDNGKLVVAHAGLSEHLQGEVSGKARHFALYGQTTGEIDAEGFPVRYPWANDYQGKAMVVYGHTRIKEPQWLNNTLCIDTGCVYGGKLTALRYPEKILVSSEV